MIAMTFIINACTSSPRIERRARNIKNISNIAAINPNKNPIKIILTFINSI